MKQKRTYPVALTIAGSDSGGGAGIQADLKTFSSLGVYGTSVITAITAQNTRQVRAVEVLSPEIVRDQLESILEDITIHAVKTGMLPTPGIIEEVARVVDTYHLPVLIVDPVMVSTSGSRLTSEDIIAAFRELLYPRLTLLTPNIPEASKLSGIEIQHTADVHRCAEVLLRQGCRAVLIKGGHMKGEQSSDLLFTRDSPPVCFSSRFIESSNLHGTGCTLASAIASYLALGHDLPEAVRLSKHYITSAIDAGKDVRIGSGNGPLNHFFDPKGI